ncbi:hypothetical protein Bhyg_03871 [Pseudolycoriella hygida]|uniref:Uncharacterized protein n=1 Tax=Pseudolycoriella hygida TaxID=35572 RepID=A0A9Q0S9T3_9DIPT|nr:hypothetical protein Bhyg_03871 [Pseudolycoriella hygida]
MASSKAFGTIQPNVPSYEEAMNMNGPSQQLYPNVTPKPYYPQTISPLADLQQPVHLVKSLCIHVLATYQPVQHTVLFYAAVYFCVCHVLHLFTVRRCVESQDFSAPVAVQESNGKSNSIFFSV